MSEIESCITLAIKALLDERCNAGYWDGVSSSPYATALALAVMIDLDERFDPAVREKAVRYLVTTQRQNGAWALGVVPGEQLPITALCYTALSIYSQRFGKSGDEALIESIHKARAYLDRALNFLQTFDINVRSYLAGMVAAHWLAQTHNIPLLPRPLEDRIDEIYAHHETRRSAVHSSKANLYESITKVVDLARRPDPIRLRELQSRQLENGSWNIQLDLTPLALLTIAKQHGSEGVLSAGCDYIRRSQNADGGFPEFAPAELTNSIYVGFYVSDVCWRTGVTMPEWLGNMQEWLYQSQNPDGSWSTSRQWPTGGDIDDTACAVCWLVNGLREDPNTSQLRAARVFIEQAQNRDGGFPTWPGQPSAVDLTAHAYLGLSALGSDESILQKAAEYLRLRQSEGGAWNAKWNVSKVYGTTRALMALAGRYQDEPFFCAGVSFLFQSQGNDGLWATAEETGMALHALLILSNWHEYRDAIERGVEALINTQNQQGYWPEQYNWTAAFSYTSRPMTLAPPLAACLIYQANLLNSEARCT